MADVSHELDALRFVVDSPLSSKVAMFNKQTQQHQQNQMLNPFSGASGRASPKPQFSKDEYGKPLAGSLTEMRGQKANMHVLREMLELCQIIDSEGYNVKDEPTMRVIPFGELFNIYNYISDKVVGILLRARKHKLVEFEGEMLFQRRDDDVPIFLLKPIAEIRHELEVKIEDIKRGSSPAPQATTLLLDKSAHKKKLGSRSSTPVASPAPSKPTTPAHSKASSPAPQSKAPSPAPGGNDYAAAARASTTATQTAQPKAVNNNEAQPTPEVTITAAPADADAEREAAESTRLEGGGAKSKSPTDNQPSDPEAAAGDPVISEDLTGGASSPISINSNTAINENVVIETTAVHTTSATAQATPAIQTDGETIATAPTLVEASAEAALKETVVINAEAHQQA